MKHKVLLTLILAATAVVMMAKPTNQARQQIKVFERSTWNAEDALDETPGYERTKHHFEQRVKVPKKWKDGSVTFTSLGANQEVWVRVNGKEAGYHAGGYTAFSFDVTPYILFGKENIIEVDITNEYNEDIPPLSADFTFFGGLYRDCFLQYAPKTHISTTFYATNGVIVEQENVSQESANLRITTHVTNPCGQQVRVEHLLNGMSVPASQEKSGTADVQVLTVSQPALWSPDQPTLYTLTTRLLNNKGTEIDRVEQEIGLRYYRFNEQGLFELNGKVVRLIGTNRHQCYDGMGWATPDSIHRRDMMNLKQMGGNFLRVSHYPQDPLVMHMCDSLGIICSVEIPIVNAITESDEFTRHSLEMLEEMVWQNRNHASVVMWGYMNEVLLRPPFRYQKGMWARHWEYVMNVNKLAGQLNNRLHEIDSERYTFAAIHDYFKEYHECGLDTLADVIGHNIYSGWYSNTIESLDEKVERLHREMKGRPQIMSEYGADCDVNLRSDDPQKFDYTLDYAMKYHQHYLELLMTTDLMAGGMAWNLNDFHSESRGGAIPHMNLKGLITVDRTPKATYYLYQSKLLPDSAARAEAERKMNEALRMPQAQEWPLCILFGSNRYYVDHEGLVWQPATSVDASRLTVFGGQPYVRKTQHGDLPASDVTILNTNEWPRYQTALMGVERILLHVPDGTYMLTLSLCELETIGEQEMSPYNLGNKALDTGFNGRKQTIHVNGGVAWDREVTGTYVAIDRPLLVTAENGKGIQIELQAQQGATIINAIKLEKQ